MSNSQTWESAESMEVNQTLYSRSPWMANAVGSCQIASTISAESASLPQPRRGEFQCAKHGMMDSTPQGKCLIVGLGVLIDPSKLGLRVC